MTDRIRIAAAQMTVTVDPKANGRAVRDAMREAAEGGARLAHFCEGALSGYAGQEGPPLAPDRPVRRVARGPAGRS